MNITLCDTRLGYALSGVLIRGKKVVVHHSGTIKKGRLINDTADVVLVVATFQLQGLLAFISCLMKVNSPCNQNVATSNMTSRDFV